MTSSCTSKPMEHTSVQKRRPPHLTFWLIECKVQYSALRSHPARNLSIALDFPGADTFPEILRTGVSSPAALSLCLAQLPVERWCLVVDSRYEV